MRAYLDYYVFREVIQCNSGSQNHQWWVRK